MRIFGNFQTTNRKSFAGRVVALVPVFMVVLLGNVGVAQASVSYWTDGFEVSPQYNWEGNHEGDAATGFDIGTGVARSGNNSGWLNTKRGWSALRIARNISGIPGKSDCSVGIYAKTVGGDITSGANVAVELWDPNGWRKIASTVVYIPVNEGYKLMPMYHLNLNGLSTVYIQGIYGNNGGPVTYARLDDAFISCSY